MIAEGISVEHQVIFTGYIAELIRVLAERAGMTPEKYILSFFATGAMHRDNQVEVAS